MCNVRITQYVYIKMDDIGDVSDTESNFSYSHEGGG